MDNGKNKQLELIEAAADTVERESRQPRFDPRTNVNNYYLAIYNWVKDAEINAPVYRPDGRQRDKWLIAFSKQEPLLDSVINTCVAVDQNRAWTMEGPQRQVSKYSQILHNVEGGWRGLMMALSSSYRRADVGGLVEVDRGYLVLPGQKIPSFTNLYKLDPTKVKLTKNGGLSYYPQGGARQEWYAWDYMRVFDDVALEESYMNMGYCMASRCLEIAKLLIAIHEHEMEKLFSKAPRGLLLLKNLTEKQWNDAMAGGGENMSDYERKYYNMLAVLATEGPDSIEAELVQLSQTPEGFNREQVINMCMYAYALAAGYDPREFWPVSSGSLGTATETEVQHRKSTGKGAMNMILQLQENIQNNTPLSISFNFDQRDVDGELKDIEVLNAKAALIAKVAGIMTTIKSERIEKTDQVADVDVDDELRAVDDDDDDDTININSSKGERPGTKGGKNQEEIDDLQQATPGVVKTSGTESALSREEVRILLAEAGIIPREWTEYEEDAIASDKTTSPEMEELRSKVRIREAAARFPLEPIVRYRWPDNRTVVLFKEGQDVLRRRYY